MASRRFVRARRHGPGWRRRPFRILGYRRDALVRSSDQNPQPAVELLGSACPACQATSALEGRHHRQRSPGRDGRQESAAFDFAGNRIQIEPLEGTQLLPYAQVPKNPKQPYHINRFIPFKAGGRILPHTIKSRAVSGDRMPRSTTISRPRTGDTGWNSKRPISSIPSKTLPGGRFTVRQARLKSAICCAYSGAT